MIESIHDSDENVSIASIKQYSLNESNIDSCKILLKNVPVDISRDYLELYIDYISGEIDIERIDRSKVDCNTVIVSFRHCIGKSDSQSNKKRPG
jgi:hypothetical protein